MQHTCGTSGFPKRIHDIQAVMSLACGLLCISDELTDLPSSTVISSRWILLQCGWYPRADI